MYLRSWSFWFRLLDERERRLVLRRPNILNHPRCFEVLRRVCLVSAFNCDHRLSIACNATIEFALIEKTRLNSR